MLIPVTSPKLRTPFAEAFVSCTLAANEVLPCRQLVTVRCLPKSRVGPGEVANFQHQEDQAWITVGSPWRDATERNITLLRLRLAHELNHLEQWLLGRKLWDPVPDSAEMVAWEQAMLDRLDTAERRMRRRFRRQAERLGYRPLGA